MDYRRFGNTIVARFDRGEEITAQLRALCEKENIRLASVEALGATDEFTVGVYNVDEHQYHALTFTGAHEIVSLTGTVNTMNGEYYSHLHMSAANESGAVVGGASQRRARERDVRDDHPRDRRRGGPLQGRCDRAESL